MKLFWQWNCLANIQTHAHAQRTHAMPTNFPTARQSMSALLHWLKPKWFSSLFLLQFQIYWHCLRPLFASYYFYGKINTRRISSSSCMQILHRDDFQVLGFLFHFGVFEYGVYFLLLPWWWFFAFTWVKIGSTQHFLAIFRKLHQIKWTTCVFYPPKIHTEHC